MTATSRWPGRVVRSGIAITLLLAFVSWGLPHLISSPLMRDRVVNLSLTGLGLEVETEAASFGWFPPTSVKGLRLVSTDGQMNIRAEKLSISRAWWQLVLFSDQLGHLEVVNPSVTLLLDSTDMSGFSLGDVPAFTANLENAEFNLRLLGMNEPVISVSGLSIDLRISHEGASYLVVKRGRVVDHRPLTPEICDRLLQLMDPTLGEVVRIEGTFSLDIQRLRVPLNVAPDKQMQQVDFEGVLHLHEVTARAKTPLLKKILRVASDLYGKQPSDVVRVVKDNRVYLQVRQGRIHYDHLVLGFPEISPDLKIYSSGSVGLDKSINLRITVPKVLVVEDAEKVDRTAVVRFHISGTVDEPRIERLPADETGEQEG